MIQNIFLWYKIWSGFRCHEIFLNTGSTGKIIASAPAPAPKPWMSIILFSNIFYIKFRIVENRIFYTRRSKSRAQSRRKTRNFDSDKFLKILTVLSIETGVQIQSHDFFPKHRFFSYFNFALWNVLNISRCCLAAFLYFFFGILNYIMIHRGDETVHHLTVFVNNSFCFPARTDALDIRNKSS